MRIKNLICDVLMFFYILCLNVECNLLVLSCTVMFYADRYYSLLGVRLFVCVFLLLGAWYCMFLPWGRCVLSHVEFNHN